MVEHVSIVDVDRHEPKHASTAISGQVLKSIGAGATAFSFPTYTELLNKPTSVGYKQLLTSSSTAGSQLPSTTNTPLQIEFGTGATTADATLNVAGLLTFHTPGQYIISTFLRFGRTGGAGQAIVFNRFLINGAQALNSNSCTLADSQVIIPFSANLLVDITTPGTTFAMEIMRDSAGINNGGLYQTLSSLVGWNNSPSATVVVYKFTGLQ